MSTRSLFLVSGERSGDLHAAELLKALQKNPSLKGLNLEFQGLGGPELQKLYGDQFEDWVEEAAVIGLSEVLKKYSWFRKKFDETLKRILNLQPALVILVDYPGFNLRLAKKLRKLGYKGHICYYISPQVWAWNRKRIPQMAKVLDLMMCVFEFEKELYESSDLPTVWVGHPVVEELNARRISISRSHSLIGLFPGSRAREVKALLPLMCDACAELLITDPHLTFELAVASDKLLPLVGEIIEASNLCTKNSLKIAVGESHRLMQEATAGWVASGTASLEAGFYGMPYALVYKVSPLTYIAAKTVVKIPYIGMVNILADKLVVKEFIQSEATVANLTHEIQEILHNKEYKATMAQNLSKVPSQLGNGDAHKKAAQAIAETLNNSATTL